MSIEISELSFKVNESFSIKDISINLKKTEQRYCLIGPNGSGKTTLIKILMLLIQNYNGEIRINQTLITEKNKDAFRKNLSACFQPSYLISGTVMDNIIYPLLIRKQDKQKALVRAKELAEKFMLTGLLDKNPETLSRGETQKVAILRSIIYKPQYLFLDEAFSSIDLVEGEGFKKSVFDYCRENHITLLFTTHSLIDALKYGEMIFVMEGGKIIQSGTIDEIRSSPKSAFIRSFFEVENYFNVEITESFDNHSQGVIGSEKIFLPRNFNKGDNVSIIIHPESLILSKNIEYLKNTSLRNVWQGKVTGLNEDMGVVKVTLSCPFELKSYITTDSLKELKLNIGDILYIGFKSSSVNIL